MNVAFNLKELYNIGKGENG